jgi:hypothetical protein
VARPSIQDTAKPNLLLKLIITGETRQRCWELEPCACAEAPYIRIRYVNTLSPTQGHFPDFGLDPKVFGFEVQKKKKG